MALKHEDACDGLCLFSIGPRRVEIWAIAPYYKIKKHRHPSHQRLELMYIAGNAVFVRQKYLNASEQQFHATAKHFGTCFTVNDAWHYFYTSAYPLIFINFSKQLSSAKSAAEDFELAPEER